MRDAVRIQARSHGKRVYKNVIRGLRTVGAPGFARSMIDVDALMERGLEGINVHQWTTSEPTRNVRVVPGSYDVQLHGVETRISVLDISARGYSLRNGFLVDPWRSVVYEKNVVPFFEDLRVGLVPLQRERRYLPGTVAWMYTASNYGHWLLLALPLLHHYGAVLGREPDWFYIGPKVSPFQIESMEMLGISRDRLVTDAVEADRILVAIADRVAGYESDALLFADRTLLTDLRPSSPTNCIFVSRARASHRQVVNEAECVAVLAERFGVVPVSTEGLSLQEEIELFRGACVVVGGHGAGLTNTVFAPSGAALVELASTTYHDSIFAQIAAAKGQRYGLVRGGAVGTHRGRPSAQHDFTVDVERVADLVDRALAESLCG